MEAQQQSLEEKIEKIVKQKVSEEQKTQEGLEKIQAQLQSLEKKRKQVMKQKVAEEQRSQERLKELEEEKLQISSAFKQMHAFLKEKERFWLKALSDLEKQMMKLQESNMSRLSREISQLSDLIQDVEGKCQQPASEFLQDASRTLVSLSCSCPGWQTYACASQDRGPAFPGALLEAGGCGHSSSPRCLEREAKQLLELSSGLEWRFKTDALKTSVLKEVMEEFEGSLKRSLSKVSVTLDPDTAHPCLVLAKDMKSLRSRGKFQELPDRPERFKGNDRCVLGHERFISGRHCWEVEVEPSSKQWGVGVIPESGTREEKVTLSPDVGVWAVGRDNGYSEVCAYTSATTCLALESQVLWKIRVFLDYDEGRVEFFDADTNNWMFSFPPASFSGVGVRPFFKVGLGVSLKC